jgi:hypothetical protein
LIADFVARRFVITNFPEHIERICRFFGVDGNGITFPKCVIWFHDADNTVFETHRNETVKYFSSVGMAICVPVQKGSGPDEAYNTLMVFFMARAVQRMEKLALEESAAVAVARGDGSGIDMEMSDEDQAMVDSATELKR